MEVFTLNISAYGNIHNAVANSNDFSNQIGSAGNAFILRNERLVLDWHPKADKPLKPRKAMAQSISAPPRSRKGKTKAVEEDPIEFYDDDSLSLDTFDRFDTPLQDDGPDIAVVQAESSLVAQPEPSSSAEQSAETLYKKMLALRANVSQSCRYFVLFYFYICSRSWFKSRLKTRPKSSTIRYCNTSALSVLAVRIIIVITAYSNRLS